MKKYVKHKKTTYYKLAAVFWLLQKNSLTPANFISDTKPKLDNDEIDFSRIRCPLCEWQPNASSRWCCGDCEYPEGLPHGCYTSWNTFNTRGLCPGCNHQWRWTSCLSCTRWSLHEDWYIKSEKAKN